MSHKIRHLHITGYCRLSNSEIKTHQGTIFQNTANLPATEWLKKIFRDSEINYPKFHKMDLLCKGAFLATELLTRQQPFTSTQTPLIFANKSGSLVSDQRHASLIQESGVLGASPATFVYTLPNIAIGEISIRHQLHSKNVFFIFEEFGNERWFDYIQICFKDEDIQQVLGGWVEVSEQNVDILIFMVEESGQGLPFRSTELQLLYNNKEHTYE